MHEIGKVSGETESKNGCRKYRRSTVELGTNPKNKNQCFRTLLKLVSLESSQMGECIEAIEPSPCQTECSVLLAQRASLELQTPFRASSVVLLRALAVAGTLDLL